jgi:hypothetical protein
MEDQITAQGSPGRNSAGAAFYNDVLAYVAKCAAAVGAHRRASSS